MNKTQMLAIMAAGMDNQSAQSIFGYGPRPAYVSPNSEAHQLKADKKRARRQAKNLINQLRMEAGR